jgi:hypothetical protein
MNKLLITAVCAAMAFPAIAAADDHGQHHDRNGRQGHNDSHRDNRGGGDRYNNGARYPYYVQNQPRYTYRGYVPYRYVPYRYAPSYPYYYGRNRRDGNDDDALWAIGGLVVGAIIGNAVAHASTPPASQPQQTCDHVAYDSAGNPYVERSCR